jgi:hypothetical protein
MESATRFVPFTDNLGKSPLPTTDVVELTFRKRITCREFADFQVAHVLLLLNCDQAPMPDIRCVPAGGDWYVSVITSCENETEKKKARSAWDLANFTCSTGCLSARRIAVLAQQIVPHCPGVTLLPQVAPPLPVGKPAAFKQLFHASKGFDPPITSLSWLSVSSQRLMLFVIYDSIVDVLLRAIWLRPDGRDHI